jgi:hypothetical protein
MALLTHLGLQLKLLHLIGLLLPDDVGSGGFAWAGLDLGVAQRLLLLASEQLLQEILLLDGECLLLYLKPVHMRGREGVLIVALCLTSQLNYPPGPC